MMHENGILCRNYEEKQDKFIDLLYLNKEGNGLFLTTYEFIKNSYNMAAY